MNAPAQIQIEPAPLLGDLSDFVDVVGFEAWFVAIGIKPRPLAVDHLQLLAERWGLAELVGADAVQRIMAEGFRE